ncbi:ultraviolet-B receptor UVR8-like isoform X2 [Chlorella sorokiniana]|uniref:Ultraviolet-B receptor UVR8-like isoform X2 n=1 Tax=Chlorella sorokiniana TaxID=3076 RepID=A0A2P6U086_CHLSO|nr:ultraviolet-B receptor UVR8-like isoform X2 [Chlorella sorokiniana]|eukprot:PRW59723.1 ultraviolet-B receptor UVR8-like isoform X2 [Chlorella sorokiniana]
MLLQCGFIANEPSGGVEPNNSHELASAAPVPVSTAVALSRPAAGGWGFALATAGDRLYSWGVNSATLLAKAGANEDGVDPADLDEVAAGVSEAAAGFDHGLAVTADGKVLVWGPAHRPAGTGTGLLLSPVPFKVPIVRVAAGEHHSLALSAIGDVFAWGSNAEGQLGSGAAGGASAEPVAVAGPASGATDAAVAAPVTAIAAGARHSVAVSSQGHCLAWGWSLHGQCGTGKAAPSVPAPTVVAALGPLKVVGAAAGIGHTIVCTDQGDAYAWGLNADGQLGDGTDLSSLEPKLVEDAALASETVTKAAAGSRHTLVLCASGRAFAFGWGAFGQLGTGKFASAARPQAVAVPGGAQVADLAAGWWHSLFLTR